MTLTSLGIWSRESDVWLNNPRRPLEASGTSGMKVLCNGGINLSVLDGWWDEAYTPSNGWAIGSGTSDSNHALQDRQDAESLYVSASKSRYS